MTPIEPNLLKLGPKHAKVYIPELPLVIYG